MDAKDITDAVVVEENKDASSTSSADATSSDICMLYKTTTDCDLYFGSQAVNEIYVPANAKHGRAKGFAFRASGYSLEFRAYGPNNVFSYNGNPIGAYRSSMIHIRVPRSMLDSLYEAFMLEERVASMKTSAGALFKNVLRATTLSLAIRKLTVEEIRAQHPDVPERMIQYAAGNLQQ